MAIPADYEVRVYAGVLGKIIGVYLGRPFEGWWYDRLAERFGEVRYYVHEELNAPLIVTDDDISGTFTFLRSLQDYGCRKDLSAAQVGQTWLNYIIQDRTILWWGGMGNSTEHTAFLRLKAGVPAPRSGSIELNGKTVAEQIGAQIFIDGWGMVAPGDPELAARLAREAASVSHDGEAIYGAQVVAAMEAAAFEENDLNCLLDMAVTLIPRDSVIYRMIGDLREWRTQEEDWHKTREKLEERYGYHVYGGNCHMVPNHGVVILGLLYGNDDFQQSLTVANTAGWDTDCNSGNVGCLMGIKNGLAGLDSGPDWRGPVADRMYLPTADGGRCITDALTEAWAVADMGRAMASPRVSGLKMSPIGDPGQADPSTGHDVVWSYRHPPKEGVRFHFSLPGAVQGFRVEDSPECRGTATLSNDLLPPVGVEGQGTASTREDAPVGSSALTASGAGASIYRSEAETPLQGTLQSRPERALKINYTGVARGRPCRVSTATFIPPEARQLGGYALIACPTLYPGQRVQARVVAGPENLSPVQVGLCARLYGAGDAVEIRRDATREVAPGAAADLAWMIDPTGGQPIFDIGLEITSTTRADGALFLDYLTWTGAPDATFEKPLGGDIMWLKAWVPGVSRLEGGDTAHPYRVMQDEGFGVASQGTREWKDYTVSAELVPRLAGRIGLTARVQGQRRFVALVLLPGRRARLIQHLDGETVLAEGPVEWELDRPCQCTLHVQGRTVTGCVEGSPALTGLCNAALDGGAVGVFCEDGRVDVGPVRVGA